ncbi:Eisosome component PIL1-domain-containing protein [Lactarius deliciosus]|nr:Eisosome component PIL1-domain-containing protein [Lactarius deliciosus]
MPPSFFSSLAGKAQNALKDSPLSQHIPSSLTGAPRPSADSPSTAADSGSTQKSHALGQIQHQLRHTTGPVQKIITAEKGVSLDFESLSRDAQAQSKELYMWGQHEQADVKDVSDRLAFLNFIAGSLSGTLAMKLDAARAPFKALRDDEVALTQRRNVRASLQNQIARLEHSQEKGSEKRIAEVKEQLAKAEKDDEPAERDHKVLLRKALKESEQEKFQALREVGGLIGARFKSLSSVLVCQPYLGSETTGTIRASLQHSLDHWKPGQATLSAPAGANLDRSHTRSFGPEHHITPQDPASPPLRGSFEGGAKPSTACTDPRFGFHYHTSNNLRAGQNSPPPVQDLGSTTTPPTASAKGKDLPVNPTVGGNEPPSTAPSVTVASPDPVDADSKVPSATPTVAETGESSSGAVPKRYESAEEEKQRLEREERERLLRGDGPSSGSSAPVYENSEEEKKRLEREEREKLLHGQTSGHGESNTHEGDTPPPYQDI